MTRSSTVCRALRIRTGVGHLAPAQLLDQREPIELREHDVDDGDVVVAAAGEPQAVLAVGRVIDGEARLAQAAADEVGDGLVVFDEQGSHRRKYTGSGRAQQPASR